MTSKQRALSVEDERLLLQFRHHSEERGYSSHTMAMNLAALREFLIYIRARCIAPHTAKPSYVTAFLRTRATLFSRKFGRLPKNGDWTRRYTSPIGRFLKLIQGQWPPSEPPRGTNELFRHELIEGYGRWLIEIRGLSEATRKKNCGAARILLDRLGARAFRDSLPGLTIADIDDFLAWRLPALRRATRSGQCMCLRSFLRYLFWAKVLPKDLSIALKGPTLYQHAEIPRAFTEPQIKAILSAARRDRSVRGLRDYAVLLMLATYGLRAGEVISLRLEDIHWQGEKLRFQQSKTRAESALPLVEPIAQALLKYLRYGRPKTAFRQIFLRTRAPIIPLRDPSSVDAIINSRMKQAGIAVDGRHGSHAFRFARALSLLRAAVPIKSIGDLLGHRSTRSTEVYLRLETEDLRSISLELPEKDRKCLKR